MGLKVGVGFAYDQIRPEMVEPGVDPEVGMDKVWYEAGPFH